MERHLASCPTCPPLYASVVGVRATLGGLRDPDTVAGLPESQQHERPDADRSEPDPQRRREWRRRQRVEDETVVEERGDEQEEQQTHPEEGVAGREEGHRIAVARVRNERHEREGHDDVDDRRDEPGAVGSLRADLGRHGARAVSPIGG